MTAAQSDTAANPGAPRYLAAIPWIGPLVGAEIGERNGTAARVPLAGAADPALGPALAAAFVPVVADAARDRYAPADPSGAPAGVLDVGWLQDLRSGDDHWFGIETEAHRLRGEFAGVLMILLYDQSPPGAAAIAARGSARLAFPIAELPAATTTTPRRAAGWSRAGSGPGCRAAPRAASCASREGTSPRSGGPRPRSFFK